MGHYAFLDENSIVINVITGKNEGEDGIDWEEFYGAKRTSYNTRGGVYYIPNTTNPDPDQSKAFRKNYAGIGYTYDSVRDAFIPPKPFDSWILNEDSCLWEAPIPYPETGSYYWNEENQQWVVFTE